MRAFGHLQWIFYVWLTWHRFSDKETARREDDRSAGSCVAACWAHLQHLQPRGGTAEQDRTVTAQGAGIWILFDHFFIIVRIRFDHCFVIRIRFDLFFFFFFCAFVWQKDYILNTTHFYCVQAKSKNKFFWRRKVHDDCCLTQQLVLHRILFSQNPIKISNHAA